MFSQVVSTLAAVGIAGIVLLQSPTAASDREAVAIIGGVCCNGLQDLLCPNGFSPTNECKAKRDWCGPSSGTRQCTKPPVPVPQALDVCAAVDPDCSPFGHDTCTGTCGPKW